ncbi:hypothetical protein [Psychrobacter lutiphocae]|uniref:hypothetical protein n=1 Tax=Psychrobacter lutiphocae TaxID=540500 RepID=UPI000360C560|nr:hypothetical protein [Psychrobacter lutiphocae]
MQKVIVLAAALMACMTVTTAVNASVGKISVFTEHQAIHMTRHRVYNPYAPTGDWPYIGRLGVEYNRNNFSYSLGYIHRSNIDIDGDEYNYDGISLGIKYTHCLVGC